MADTINVVDALVGRVFLLPDDIPVIIETAKQDPHFPGYHINNRFFISVGNASQIIKKKKIHKVDQILDNGEFYVGS
jgi:hypothetical protein